MKILVIGSGGREHALVWKLAQSPHVTRLWCAPGNAGIAQERLAKNGALVQCVNLGAEDLPGLRAFAQENRADLTVVGPDNPLALGIVDLLQKDGRRIWGPNQKAARFEASKVFSQRFMEQIRHPHRPRRHLRRFPRRLALRRLAGRTLRRQSRRPGARQRRPDLPRHGPGRPAPSRRCSSRSAFGAAGASIVIQELLEGMEISLHALCDGQTAKLFPTSQDHKRALDGDRGLNTGGMGAYSPTPFLSEPELAAVGRSILDPWLRGCAAEGIDFHGILYPGVMLTKDGPKVLEFNARFGDPETQVYLTRLENDLVELLAASMDGTLAQIELKWNPMPSVCVVMASAGYPGSYAKGKPIRGLDEAARLPNTKVFHAGTARAGDQIVTTGGRVLGVTAWAKDLQERPRRRLRRRGQPSASRAPTSAATSPPRPWPEINELSCSIRPLRASPGWLSHAVAMHKTCTRQAQA